MHTSCGVGVEVNTRIAIPDKAEAAGMIPATINRVRRCLWASLTTAKRQGSVYRNVARLTEPLNKERDAMLPLTADEIARLYTHDFRLPDGEQTRQLL
jgi:hypothetical protein